MIAKVRIILVLLLVLAAALGFLRGAHGQGTNVQGNPPPFAMCWCDGLAQYVDCAAWVSNPACYLSNGLIIADNTLPSLTNEIVQSLASGASTSIDTGTICRVLLWGSNNQVQVSSVGSNVTAALANDIVVAETNAGSRIMNGIVRVATSAVPRQASWVSATTLASTTINGLLTNYGLATQTAYNPGDLYDPANVVAAWQGGAYTPLIGNGDVADGVFGLEGHSTVGDVSYVLTPGLEYITLSTPEFQSVQGWMGSGYGNTVHNDRVVAFMKVFGDMLVWMFDLLCLYICFRGLFGAVNWMQGSTGNTEATGETIAGVNINIFLQKYNLALSLGAIGALVAYWLGFTYVFHTLTISPQSALNVFIGEDPSGYASWIASDLTDFIEQIFRADDYLIGGSTTISVVVSTWGIAAVLKWFQSLAKA